MRRLILCLERLNRILRVLQRTGGTATLRDLWRTYAIRQWEVRQAAQMGWLTITARKPRVGRPSWIVSVNEFCGEVSANMPLPRRDIEKGLSNRHIVFARNAVFNCSPRGMRGFGFSMPGIVHAYISVYQPQSAAGARASVSRLTRRRDVRAVMQFYYAKACGELPEGEPMPDTASAIRARFVELGNFRARRI